MRRGRRKRMGKMMGKRRTRMGRKETRRNKKMRMQIMTDAIG